MTALLAQAFLLGLSVGPACLGYCAPVCVPYVASEERATWQAAGRALTLFLLGRLVGYSIVGSAVGLLGTGLMRTASPWVWGVLRLALGLLLIVFGLVTNPARPGPCPGASQSGRSIALAPAIGLLTGLNICPPFAAAIGGAAGAGSTLRALLYFWSFFAGTSVYFVPLVVLGRLSRLEAFRQVARISLFLAGAWLALEGAFSLL